MAPAITILKYRDDGMPKNVAVYRARCGSDNCLLLFYMYRDEPYVVIVPARPSPLCSLVDLENARIVSRIIYDLGIISAYLPACRVSRSLVRASIEETIKNLIGLGIVDEIT